MKRNANNQPIEYTRKDGETVKLQRVELIKIGEYVRRKDGKEVFSRQPFERFNNGYQLDSEDDISRTKYVKRGTYLEIDFEY